jgi:hypothetical protein
MTMPLPRTSTTIVAALVEWQSVTPEGSWSWTPPTA